MLKKVMIILIILFGMAGCLKKPEPRIGDFNAVVLDSLTNEPVPGVEVSIGDQPDTTDLKGQFSLMGLAPGEYRVKLERDWYHSKEITYHHLGKPELVEFYLQPEELNGRILYSLYKPGNRGLFQLDLKSREITKIRDLANKNETNPCWICSDKIAFEQNLDDDTEIIQFLNLTSQDNETFVEGEHPSFDQIGNMVVYKSDEKIITKFNLKDRVTKIYKPAGFNPVISPDGTMVAYTSGNRNSLIIDFNGSELYFTPDGAFKDYNLGNPCWSPDGEKIAFEAYTNSDDQRAIYYISVDSLKSGMKQITFPTGGKEQHKHPTWGEDNTIYFSGNIIYSSRSDIYAVRIGDGHEWIMVSKGSGSKDYPCWGE